MKSFPTIPSDHTPPLPVVSVGAGLMGRAWLAVLEESDDVELVGIVDIDTEAAHRSAVELGRPDLPVGHDTVALARSCGAQAVIDVTIPVAHHAITTAALFAGLPVLGEKPVADTLPRALSLAAASEVTGQLFMVSQNRRWNPQVAALRGMVEGLGAIGTMTTQFFKAPHFGGFREQMDHPLLLDMAIHPFDTARYLLGAEAVSVYCEAHNPSWSWYAGDANASAIFEMDGGARYTFTGSWCAPGAETSWNGSWRVSGEKGSALWDGDAEPWTDAGTPPRVRPPSPYSGIAGSLQVFLEALRTGTSPMGEVHENVMSLAMVEAAVLSARTRRRVLLDDVLARAHEQAVAQEMHPEVRAVLAGWGCVRSALASPVESVEGTGRGSGVR
jgi:predicted dehydrogenase